MPQSEDFDESSQPNNQYRPGHCNIGDREVSVRKKFFTFFVITTLALTLASFYYCNSLVCWLAMFISSFASIVIYIEIKYRFCILFGFFNLYNFGKLGNLNEVHNKCDCKKDRKRVTQIVMQSLFVALVYSSAVHYFAMNHHL